MISSMRGNVVGDGDVVDGNVAFKARDVGDNGGMTCEVEVFEGDVEYAGGMKVSRVVWNTQVVWKSNQWNDQQHDHSIDHHLTHQLDQVNHDLVHHLSLFLDL